MLWYQSGWVAAPALEANTAIEPLPRSRYIIGLIGSLPDLAPVVCSSSSGASSKLPPTLPPFARNSRDDRGVPVAGVGGSAHSGDPSGGRVVGGVGLKVSEVAVYQPILGP